MDVLQSTDQSEIKRKAWQRYMSTHKGSDYQEYVKAMNENRTALNSTGEVPHLKRNDGK